MSLDKPIQILDSKGQPYPYSGPSTGAQIYEGSQDTRQRMARPYLDADIQRLMSRQKHRMLLSDSRYIASTYPMVDGAVSQKADYVCSGGCMPIFTGKDKAYGAAVKPALHSALNIIDARGPLFSFAKDMWIACRLLDIDTDFFIAHFRTETGFPQVQFLEAHRIGCRNGERVVEQGPYKGLPILNGIIYTPQGREVAYRFLADDPKQDRDLSALDVTHVADARWFSDGRPFPAIASAILDWYDVKETRGYEKIAAKTNAALALIETNETGAARPGLLSGSVPTQASGTAAVPPPEFLGGGLIRYVKAGPGHDVKAHQSNRPSDAWQKFDERIVAGAFYGMGWRVEMFDLSKLSGAPTRGFQDNINTAIHSRWSVLAPAMLSIVRRTVAALADRGDIPKHPEWDQWAMPPPVDFTVDANKDRQTDVLMVESGFTSTSAVVRKLGYASSREVIMEQAERIADQQEIAAEVSKARGVEIDWRDLGNPKRNPGAQAPEAAAPAGKP